jgi:hypothetical protein
VNTPGIRTPQSRRRLLRWLLVPPAALAGWWFALLLGMGLLAIGDSQCPAAQKVSGACIAGWYAHFERAVFVSCSAVAACLVVLLPALAAPAHRRRVAWIAFAWGAATAAWLGLGAGAHVELAAALSAGFATTLLVHRYRVRIVRD